MPEFLTKEQVSLLKQAHKEIKDKKLADRVKAVLSLNSGFEYAQVAEILLLDETTLRRYVQKFQDHGLPGLVETHYLGSQSRLTATQLLELKTHFTLNTPQTVSGVMSFIHRQYKVAYSTIGATKLMHRLGFVYKKPKLIPGKVDLLAQSAFIQNYRDLKKNLAGNDQIYFTDATHPTHNTKAAYGWILRGKKNDKYIKSNTGRNRLNLNGALNLSNKKVIVFEEMTVNSFSTIRLLGEIKRKQRTGKAYVILDNASYHHSREVKRWLFHHPRFKLVYLPPYSPNLNPIERLWKLYHSKITNNHYFESFKDFKRQTLEFFKNLKQYRQELNSLLTDNFQVLPDLNAIPG